MSINISSISAAHNAACPRIGLYGTDGIGKSTLGSQMPSPVFIQAEDGLGGLSCNAFPLATCYQDILDAIGVLYTDKHEYRTVIVDSVDWVEQLLWAHLAREGKHDSIEGYGYGKGYVLAAERFRELLDGLNALRLERKMMVLLIAHSQVKRFDDPTCEPYDRYCLKLHARIASMVAEWVDILAFATQPLITKKEDVGFNQKKSRGIQTGERVMRLSKTPAYDAKNRFNLPDELPLSWLALENALKVSP